MRRIESRLFGVATLTVALATPACANDSVAPVEAPEEYVLAPELASYEAAELSSHEIMEVAGQSS